MDAPRMTPSMRTALEDLKLEQIAVVYPGTKRYSLGARVMRLGSKGTGKDQRPMLLLLNQPEAGKTLNPVERTSLAVTIRHTLCDQSQELKWIQSRGKD